MANEISTTGPSGLTLYAIVRDANNQVYRADTEVFEALTDANWTSYDIALSASNVATIYLASFPVLDAGAYNVWIYRQVGATPASTDIPYSVGRMEWNGEEEVTVATAVSSTGVEGNDLLVRRGDTLTANVIALGDLTDRTKLWFTVKRKPSSDLDSAALIQVTEAAGAVYLNAAAAPTSSDASITVTNAVTGALTLLLKAALTAVLAPGRYHYDFQQLTPSGVTTLAEGAFKVSADVTKAVA